MIQICKMLDAKELTFVKILVSRPMPDGRRQEPGGWNRMVLQVQDLSARITELKKEGVHFRNEMEVGPVVLVLS